MKRVLSALVALSLAGCAHVQQGYAFPTLDDLSEEAKKDCPPAEQVTGELGDLATKDAALGVQYAACQKRHTTARDAYLKAQQLLAEAAAKAKAQNKGSNK